LLAKWQLLAYWRQLGEVEDIVECKRAGLAVLREAGFDGSPRSTKNFVSAGQEGFLGTVICYEGENAVLHVSYVDEVEGWTMALEFLEAMESAYSREIDPSRKLAVLPSAPVTVAAIPMVSRSLAQADPALGQN
jgi:hypothetical protein